VTQAVGVITFSWTAVVGQPYQIQHSTNLTATTWNTVGSISGATNGIMTASDLIGSNAKRFYRVVGSP